MSSIPQDVWMAVHVKSWCEERVCTALLQKGYECFLPRQWSRDLNGRHQLRAIPLFLCYLFFRCFRSSSGSIVTTPGVIGIVGCGGRPSVVPDEEIEYLKKIEKMQSQSQPWAYFRSAERIQIEEGPLAGMVGTLLEIRNKRHLVVSIDAVMRSVTVEIGSVRIRNVA